MKTEKPSFHNALDSLGEATSSLPNIKFSEDRVTEKDVSLIVKFGKWAISCLIIVVLVTVYLEGRYAPLSDFRIFKEESKASTNLLRSDVVAMSRFKTLTISVIVLGTREQIIMDRLFELALAKKSKSVNAEEMANISALEERFKKELRDTLQRKLLLEAELRSLPPVYTGGHKPAFR